MFPDITIPLPPQYLETEPQYQETGHSRHPTNYYCSETSYHGNSILNCKLIKIIILNKIK